MTATQRQPDGWIETAPHRCEASREIDAPPGDIWAQLADHESWPEWFDAVKSVEVTGAPSGVGAERRVHLSGVTVDEEFVAWEVGERYAFTAVAMSPGLFRSLNERVTIEEVGGGRSLVTYTQAFDPNWWFRLPFRVVQGQFRRSLDAALEGLSDRVES